MCPLVQNVILIYLVQYAKSMKEIQYYGPADVLPFVRIVEFLWAYVGSALVCVVGVKFMDTVRFIQFQVVNNSVAIISWHLKDFTYESSGNNLYTSSFQVLGI